MRPPDVRSGLDTSVLVRLLTGAPEPLARSAFQYLDDTQARGQRVLVSDLVIAEAYFACQHHYKIPKEAVLAGLLTLLAEPIFAVDPNLIKLLSLSGLATAKPGFIDRLIHAEYTRQGAALVTFEKSAGRLADVEVLSKPE